MDTIYKRVSEHQLTVHCPKCDFEAKHRVLTILQYKKVVCPRCGSLNAVDTAHLEEKITSIQAKRNSQPRPDGGSA